MIVGDPELVDAHDIGMIDLPDDLVFLQEAIEELSILQGLRK